MNISRRKDLNTETLSLNIHRLVERRRKWGQANVLGVNPEQYVMHGRIAHQGHFADVLRGQIHFLSGLLGDRVKSFDDRILKFLKAGFFVQHNIGDTRHHVFTEFYLGIHHGFGCQHLAGIQIGQICSHGGGAYIHSKPNVGFNSAGLDTNNLLLLPERHRYFPIRVPQYVRQCLKRPIIDGKLLAPVNFLEAGTEPFKVSVRILQGRFRELYIKLFNRRFYLDLDLAGRLADNLLAGAGCLGDKNKYIPQNSG